ncbi:hypothetical protein [Alkalihalobacillus sp. CinArs1]|uniref:hypothetical protein n=1 Tax=Alkalihalobacillus sp. CinArs1 TaxID=2995314 RepID=UPI0022DDB58A|nr:hypothetical protein [Alkalihalobacillus sp. CinArs1]
MKKLSVILAILMVSVPFRVEASSLQNSFLFKCTVISQGVENEWEFSSPNEYEVEKGSLVRKGADAKEDVTSLYEHLNVSELSQVDELVTRIKKYGYDADRFEMKWMDANGRLYTWVWDKEDSE